MATRNTQFRPSKLVRSLTLAGLATLLGAAPALQAQQAEQQPAQVQEEDIEVITDATDLIKKLNGVRFTWKVNDRKSLGVIAQEVEELFPELISERTDTGTKSVNYNGLVGVLIEAVKELSTRVEELEKKQL